MTEVITLPQDRAQPTPGTVYINPRKYEWSLPTDYKDSGDIRIGMMGVSVIHEDGHIVLYPWRVVDRVEFTEG